MIMTAVTFHLAFTLASLFLHRFLCASSLVAPKYSLRDVSRRLHNSFGSSLEGDDTATAVLENNERDENYRARSPPTMVPLSRPPLLLLQSSAPIISSDACSLLSRYFDRRGNNGDDAHQLDERQNHLAGTLLSEIHDVIDSVTDCPRHDGEVLLPNYVRYDLTAIDNDLLLDGKRFGNALLPDGLHVDTNNGKLFRHVTAILYLTDNKDVFPMDEIYDADGGPMVEDTLVAGGGTTFPLAIPFHENGSSQRSNLSDVARRLLERNISHTKGDASENASSEGRILEKAALDVFHCNNKNVLSSLNEKYSYHHTNAKRRGVRVMPEAGKLIYFHNIDENGMPDPLSFHGGEELITILPNHRGSIDGSNTMVVKNTKSILVFFKEIAVRNFRDRGIDGFAEEVERSRSWTEKMYF